MLPSDWPLTALSIFSLPLVAPSLSALSLPCSPCPLTALFSIALSLQVSPDSAAEAAGLRLGDRVLGIRGVGYEPAMLSAEGLRAALRGELSATDAYVGEHVELLVKRGEAEARTVSLQRRAVPSTPSPSTVRSEMLADGRGRRVGYVRIKQFTETGTAELAAALEGMRASGAVGFVLDLRNNPGGQLTEALAQVRCLRSLLVTSGRFLLLLIASDCF